MSRTKYEQDHFDRLVAEQGETWWGNKTAAGAERMRRRARLLAARIQAFEDPTMIELGCGTGTFSRYILEALPKARLTGIDASGGAVRCAASLRERYPQARFVAGDVLALPCPSEAADVVTGNSVLHHLPVEDCLAEVYRVLKAGGVFHISEPNMMNPQIAVEKNVKWIGNLLQNTADETAFFRWRLAAALKRHGFRHVRVTPFDFLHPLVPKYGMNVVDRLGKVLERLPGVREISGSLLIEAQK